MNPRKIFLIRHGQSEGNHDNGIYSLKPDYALELTERGHQQAREAGRILKAIVGEERLAFYVSPFWRTRMTFEGVAEQFDRGQISYKEDPRLREQEWGHLRSKEEIARVIAERNEYGTFYFRFVDGESGADVFDRISDFLGTLRRDFEQVDFPPNVVIISHGMSLRLFLMRWFHWTVEEFEVVQNPDNCEMIVLEETENQKYRIATPLRTQAVLHKYQRPVKF